jgi:hypothetical protein
LELLGIPGIALVQGGAVAVLTMVVLAKANHRGDEWRAASQTQDARNDVLTQHVEQLLEAARTTNALIEGLKQASQEKRL